MHFIICELLWFLEICCKVLPRVRIKTTAPKHHITHRNVFFTVLESFVVNWKFFQQSLWAALHCISTGHTHFSTYKIHIFSCEPDRPSWVLFSCEMAVNTARKAWFEVCGELPHTARKKEHLWAKVYQCLSEIQALFSLNFSYMGCFNQLMVCSCGCRKANKYTNIHTYTLLENKFKKPGARPHSWRRPAVSARLV